MTLKKLLFTASLLPLPIILSGQGQGLDPSQLFKALSDSWPTYAGDYSGKRFSLLKQVDRTTVKNLTLAWVARLTEGTGAAGFGAGGRGGGRGGGAGLIIGGE